MRILSKFAVTSFAALSLAALSGCAPNNHENKMEQQRWAEMQTQHNQTIQSIEQTKTVIMEAQKSNSSKKMKEALTKAQAELQAIEDKLGKCPAQMGMKSDRCGGYLCKCGCGA